LLSNRKPDLSHPFLTSRWQCHECICAPSCSHTCAPPVEGPVSPPGCNGCIRQGSSQACIEAGLLEEAHVSREDLVRDLQAGHKGGGGVDVGVEAVGRQVQGSCCWWLPLFQNNLHSGSEKQQQRDAATQAGQAGQAYMELCCKSRCCRPHIRHTHIGEVPSIPMGAWAVPLHTRQDTAQACQGGAGHCLDFATKQLTPVLLCCKVH
jgi:hypothetical protein